MDQWSMVKKPFNKGNFWKKKKHLINEFSDIESEGNYPFLFAVIKEPFSQWNFMNILINKWFNMETLRNFSHSHSNNWV